MGLTAAGNLGIGTTAPASILNTSGSSQGITHDDSATGKGYLRFRNSGTQLALFGIAGTFEGSSLQDTMIAAETGLNIRFYTNGSATTKMFISGSGNVGIGTTNPTWKLTILGNNDILLPLLASVFLFTAVAVGLRQIEIKNQFFGLTQNFGNYRSDYKLVLYYDAKFIKGYQLIDLSEKGNNGWIYNCEIIGYTFDDYKEIKIPHRRESTFKLLPHEENGYENGGWKNQTTRYNQLRFHNEVLINSKEIESNGLSTCKFREFGKETVDNIIHINVGI
jgi:hypothetical protein